MASQDLIEAYLADLARTLPAGAVDELADGLAETYRHHLARGLTPERAAAGAIAEFGEPVEVITAFTQHSPGRRAARFLLFSGPAVGLIWGSSLLAGRIWTWHVPPGAGIAFGATLLAVVALLLVAAATGPHYRRTRLAALAGTGIVLLDLTMLAAVALLAAAITWPLALACVASLARIGWTVRALPGILTSNAHAG